MSQMDMRQEDAGRTAEPPIVVCLGRGNVQAYLKPENEVLRAVYGFAPERAEVASKDVGWQYVYPHYEAHALVLLRDMPQLSYGDLQALLQDEHRLDSLLIEHLEDAIKSALLDPTDGWRKQVAILLVQEDWLMKESVLRRVLQSNYNPFVGVPVFVHSGDPHIVPERWVPCPDCGRNMEPAGTAYWCKECGSVGG